MASKAQTLKAVPEEGAELSYVTMNAQTKANALLQRLQVLESEHYQQGVLADESTVLGSEEQVQAHREAQHQVEHRIDYIKTRLNELGVQLPESE